MKNLTCKPLRFIPAVLGLVFSLLANHAGAGVSYWDPNGTGSVGGNGTWDTATKQWSPNSTQIASASLVAWPAGNASCFCADAGGSTLNGTWDTATKQWSPNSTQIASASLVAWPAGNAACFCADAGGSTLNGTFIIN